MGSKTLVHIFLIVVIGILTYSNSFDSPFHFDDEFYITKNPIVSNLTFFTDLSEAEKFRSTYCYNTLKMRYLGMLTFALNYKLHGLDVTGYHIVNLAIHIINALLVYWLVLLTLKLQVTSYKLQDSLSTVNGQQSMNLIALFSALIFVSHPVQTQAVTYITQRFALLAVMFYLLSLVLYIRFRTQSTEPAYQTGRHRTQTIEQKTQSSELRAQSTNKRKKIFSLSSVFWYLGSVFSAVLAMKTKEIAFTLPAIVVLYEFTFFGGQQSGKDKRKRLLLLIPLFLTILIIPLSLMGTYKPDGGSVSSLDDASRAISPMPRLHYLFTEFRVIVTYLRLLFVPINQNLDYDYPVYSSFLNPNVFLSFLFLLAIFGLGIYLFYCSRQHPPQSLPTGQAGPLDKGGIEGGSPFDKGGTKGELPNISESSQAKACGYLQLETRCGSPLRVAPTCNLKLISFGIFWFFITLSIESSIIPTLDIIFEHRLYLPSIGLIIAFVSLVFYIFSRLTSRLSLTACYLLLTAFVVMLSITANTRNIVWQSNVAIWEDVIKKSPRKARGYSNIGKIYLEAGLNDKAIEHLQIALQLNPNNATAHNNLGVAYSYNNPDRTIAHYQTAIELNPDYAEAHFNLGVIYLEKCEDEKARREFETVLQINPDYHEARKFLKYLSD